MIKTLPHMPYTRYKDFIAESGDLSELPKDCQDGSTCIMSDTGKEYVFHKPEGEWKEEKRPIPGFIWTGEWTALDAIENPIYGSLASIEGADRELYWFDGVSWIKILG